MFISYLLVFLLAAIPLFELITVIPLAIIGGLSPVPVAILGFLGNLLTVLLLIIFIDKVKGWLAARKQKQAGMKEQDEELIKTGEVESLEQNSKKEKRAKLLFDKYGLPGLLIIGPLIVGSHISALMGMSFGSKRGAVIGWMIVSLIIWTITASVLVNSGVTLLIPDVEKNGFLIRIFQ